MNRFQHSRPYLGPSSDFGTPAAPRLYNKSLRMLNGNDQEAFRLNCIAAESGMHDAVLAMGWFYLNGIGVAADEEEALRWYRKSARQGDSRALFSLGAIAYLREDFNDALAWLDRAQKKGHHRSAFWIGKMYWRGQGVQKDRKQARRLFAEAAAHRVIEAQKAIRFLDHCSRGQRS